VTYLGAVEELVLSEVLAEAESLLRVFPDGLHVIVDSQDLLVVLQIPLCNDFSKGKGLALFLCSLHSQLRK